MILCRREGDTFYMQEESVNTPWETIINLAIELIRECIAKGQGDDAVKRQVRDPGPFQRLRIERGVRLELGLRPREWRQRRDEIMPQVYAASQAAHDNDLDALLLEAKEEE